MTTDSTLAAEDLALQIAEAMAELEATKDEVLALVAYLHHNQTTPLVAAKEAGADIGKIGNDAHLLKNRISK